MIRICSPFGRLSALLLAAVLLGGCQSFNETMSSIDWKDKGSVGPAALDASPLSARVVEVLAITSLTMNQQIKVGQLQGSRIRLSGSATSSSAAAEAVRISHQVEGVGDVLDTISVR